MSKVKTTKHPSVPEGVQQKPCIEDNYRAEVARKLFHMTSLAFPAIYYFINKPSALQILIPITLLILVMDIAKKFHRPSGEAFIRVFGYIMRRYERDTQLKSLNGVTCFFIAASVATFVFPKYVTIMSFLMLTFSDTASALAGRRFGRTKIRGRSLEGSLAFVATAVIVILLTPKIEYRTGEYLIAGIAAIVGAATELLSGDLINDNIVIPLCIGAALWLLYFLVYPSINLNQFGVI